MSFREKSAWVTLIALLLVSLLYGLHVPNPLDPPNAHWAMHVLVLSVGVFVVIEVVAYLVLRLRNPEDAATPKDEREQLIDLKAIRIAYYCFVVLSFLGIFMMMHVVRANPGSVGFAVTLALVVAEIARQLARIVFYRRGV